MKTNTLKRFIHYSLIFKTIITVLFFFSSCQPSTNSATEEKTEQVVESTEEAQALSLKTYVDPDGYFEIIPPAGWDIEDYPDDPRGKVAFIGPVSKLDLRVLVNAVDFNSTEGLIEFCKDMEDRIGFSTNIKVIDFNGYEAVERTFVYSGIKFLYIDFVLNSVDHNIAFGCPPSQFDSYKETAFKSMATYYPVRKDLSEDEAKEHVVAKNLRLARLWMEMDNREQAMKYIEAGLEVSPDNDSLLYYKSVLEQ